MAKYHKDDKEGRQEDIEQKIKKISKFKRLVELTQFLDTLPKDENNNNLSKCGLKINNIKRLDPVILNDVVDKEWSFSRARVEYFKQLAEMEEKVNSKQILDL